jgi:hypothetical protein
MTIDRIPKLEHRVPGITARDDAFSVGHSTSVIKTDLRAISGIEYAVERRGHRNGGF